MLVLVVEPGKVPEVKEIAGDLKEMQSIVGGHIELVYPFEEPVALICNEEGKIQHLRANRGLCDEHGNLYEIICGTFFLCGAPEDSDSLTGLTAVQIEKYERRFHLPEIFVGSAGKIIALPMDAYEMSV